MRNGTTDRRVGGIGANSSKVTAPDHAEMSDSDDSDGGVYSADSEEETVFWIQSDGPDAPKALALAPAAQAAAAAAAAGKPSQSQSDE